MSGWEIYAVVFAVFSLLIGLLVWQAKSGAIDRTKKKQLKTAGKLHEQYDKAAATARRLWDSVRPSGD